MKKTQQNRPVVMDATGKGDHDASGRGSFLGTLDTSTLEGAAQRNQASVAAKGAAVEEEQPTETSVNEHLESLFGGENLSEEFMNKASVVFEAALNEKTTQIKEKVLQESAVLVEEAISEGVNELAGRLDEYLSYVVEEWLKENKLAVESGIRTEIAESFIGGLKNLFTTHYIEVPEKKHDVLEDLFDENSQLEDTLNEQIKVNVELSKEITTSKARSVFLEAVSDMSQLDAERLASLAESIDFSNPEEFKRKITVLKENYLKAAPVSARPFESLSDQKPAPETLTGPMSVYMDTLTRQTKTY